MRPPCAGRLLGLVFLLLSFPLSGAPPLHAQSRPDPPPDSLLAPLLVKDVRFAGDTYFPDETLRLRIRTRANRRFLGLPGVTWWLWLYRFGERGVLGRRVGEAFMASGEPPAFLDAGVLAADAERLRLFYLQEGFRDAQVAVRVDTVAGGAGIDVTFAVEPGAPTYVRQVRYEGVEGLGAEQQLRLARGSLLQPERVDRAAPLAFRTDGQRYSEPQLLEERRRLLAFLRDEGYAAASRDSIRALVYPQSPDSFDVVFRIRPGPRYRFGDVVFDVTGPEAGAGPRTDTLARGDGGVVTMRLREEGRLSAGLLRRALRFRPGNWYDQSLLVATKRRLEGTGVFAFSDIIPLAPVPPADTASAPRLPHRIELRTRERHRIRLETFMLQRSGEFGGSGSELGTGVGFSYENANLLGGGETFRVGATGSVAGNLEDGLFTSAQAEGSASLTVPYLTAPFGSLERALRLYEARTRVSFSLLTARRDELRLVIRGRGNARLRFELQHTPALTSLVDLLDLSVSNPDTLAEFEERFLSQVLGSEDEPIVLDPVQRAQILEDYTQPQINNALRYTLRAARVDPLRRMRGYSYEAALEAGGNLPYLLDALVYSPDTLEGSLPGLPFFQGDRADNRLVYRQYVRFTGDARRYLPVSRRAVLALKGVAGLAHPIGRAEVVPFDRRFYSGGAAGVRGWGLRELGPGRARFATSDTLEAEGTNILGGDVKLEAGVELRGTMLRGVLGADWLGVLFVDAGNVWFGPRNPGFGEAVAGEADGRFRLRTFYEEIGVGSGLGLRLAWEYLIVRLDLAYKVYDPVRSDAGLFPDALRRPQLHFGIGHAF